MKIRKEAKAEIMAFYVGGAKFHASTTHAKEELETIIENALDAGKSYAKLDTVNEDESIESDSLTLLFDKLMFYSVLQKNTSQIINLPGIGDRTN